MLHFIFKSRSGRAQIAALAPALVLALFARPATVMAQATLVFQAEERERWHGEDNLYGEGYGWRIAMVGNRLVTAGWHKAVVWEHEAGDWHAMQVLDPSVGRIEDVAISGNWIAFGSPHDLYGLAPPVGGDVSLFRYTADSVWVEHPVVLGEPDNSLTGFEVHSFGSSVDLDSTRLVVSAPDSRECCAGNTDGPGFVFSYTWDGANWVMDDWVTSSDPWRFFGASIDLMGDYLIVGAPRDPNLAGPNEYGAAFVFVDVDPLGWIKRSQTNPITTPDEFNDMNFGRHVGATSGPWFAVAADDGVKFLTPTAIPLPWEERVVPLPGRRTSRLTDGVGCDLDRVLYVDSTNDETATIERVNDQWTESPALATEIVTTEPVGMAISGWRAAVGYPYEDLAGRNTGAVITYQEVSDVLVIDETLTYGDATPGDKFGIAIDVASTGGGNALAIVGAPNDLDGQTRAGAAYIYRYNAFEDAWDKLERWQPGSDLTPVGPRGSPGFGTAVACDGYNRLAVGAPDNFVNGQWTGSVHVRHEGSGETMLVPANSEERFGASLAYQNDTLIVGAPDADTGKGVVYAYTHSDQAGAWGPPERLGVGVPMRTAGFGTALALDEPNGTLVIGAPRDFGVDMLTGAVYVYGRGATWVFEDKLSVASGTSGDLFGQSVAVGGGFLFVGAPGDDTAANDGGSVHVFEWAQGAWTHVDQFTAPDAQPDDAFGSSMWLSGDDLFIGAPGVDDGASEVGAVYTYRRFGATWVAATGRIVHANPVDYDLGANPVAYIGDMLLSGAIGEDGAADDAGAVIVHSYSAHVEVPSPLDPGPGGQPCRSDFEVVFSQTIVSPIDPAVYHYYADQVDVSGDTMAVGELAAETTYINAQGQAQIYPIGAVHLYRRTAINAWTLEETIFPPAEDVVPTRFVASFGVSLALDGNLLVVGNGYAYFVHVYERTPGGWVLRTRIASGMANLFGFGVHGLDVSGSTIMIGAPGYTQTGWPGGAGAVLFYERISEDAWGLNAGPLLSQVHFPYGEHLGQRASLDSAAGRAVATGTGLEGYRSAYIFERVSGVWQEVAIINADPDDASGGFGSGLAIDGNTVVVGDAFYSTGPQQPGAAFVWEHDGMSWSSPTVLLGSNPSTQDSAGTSVAVDGDIIVVGAPTAYTQYPGGIRTGAAYVFGRQAGLWSERLRLLPSDTSVREFGHSTSVSGGIVLSGTPSQYGAFLFTYDLGCAPLPCPGDFNGDGVRDLADFAILQNNLGQTAAGHEDGDADGDGDVDLDDLNVFTTNIGVPCP